MRLIILSLLVLVTGLADAAAQTNLLRVPVLKGILFINSLKDVKDEGVPAMTGISVRGLKTLERPSFNHVVEPFLGKPLDDHTMKELQTAVIHYYRDQGKPVVDVVYLDQDVSNGVVQVVVLEGRLGKVRYEYFKYSDGTAELWSPKTNGWTTPAYLEKNLRLRPNDIIDESQLQHDLEALDRNPLRELHPFFAPGAQFGTSDLVLRVHEQRPFQVSVGYDDTGTRLTDLNRINAGVLWGKAFGVTDSLMTYQFVGDPALAHLRAHIGDYVLPLPWGHRLHLFGYYLDAKADLGNGVTLAGPSYQTSFRYEITLPSLGKYRHQIAAGLDFKSAENTLALNAVTAANTPTEIFQTALGYTGALSDPWGATTLAAQFYYSPGGVTAKNTDVFFDQSRFDAKASYLYGRAELQRQTRLPGGLAWVVRGTGQFADGNLLPTEQLGLGGYNTVRGYDDRQVNSDQGWIVSNEIWSPAMHPLSEWAKWGWGHDSMSLLAFFDYGEGSNVNLLPGEQKTQSLYSVGGGLRYQLRKNLELRFDYGWQLHHLSTSPVRSRGHVAVTMRF